MFIDNTDDYDDLEMAKQVGAYVLLPGLIILPLAIDFAVTIIIVKWKDILAAPFRMFVSPFQALEDALILPLLNVFVLVPWYIDGRLLDADLQTTLGEIPTSSR